MNKIEISREKIIELAGKAGFGSNPFSDILVRHSDGSWVGVEDQLTEFTRLLIDEIETQKSDVDGWIEWTGDYYCPVPGDTVVEVRLRNMEVSPGRADDYHWSHYGIGGDIVAYRVIEENHD